MLGILLVRVVNVICFKGGKGDVIDHFRGSF